MCVFHQLWFKPHKNFDFEVFSIYELNTPKYLTIFLVKAEVIIFMCRDVAMRVRHRVPWNTFGDFSTKN
jgi:hypothetical protein